MAATVEIKYFNSFWVKKTNNQYTDDNGGGLSLLPVWPGLPYKDQANNGYINWHGSGQPQANVNSASQTYNWIIEV